VLDNGASVHLSDARSLPVRRLMGHATIEMTMGCAHLSSEARESAVQELDRPIPQPRAALG